MVNHRRMYGSYGHDRTADRPARDEFAGMMLADQGADVVRVDRVPAGDARDPRRPDVLGRSRRSIALDLKTASAREAALRLVERSDVLPPVLTPIEG
ncbi:CoA transferase [Streptomyces sp. NPDC055681]